MFDKIIKNLDKGEMSNKKKIENLVFLVITLIILIIIINIVLKENKSFEKEEIDQIDNSKTLSLTTDNISSKNDLETNLESILSSIKGVGKVKVFINYSESSKTVAMYDEKTTISSTEENDSNGGIRNTTSTETQRDVIYSDSSGTKAPVTEKIVMPAIQGAIITAEGVSNATIKSNIIDAVQAATGLTIDKIQVFEME